jgi:hypothetical protein
MLSIEKRREMPIYISTPRDITAIRTLYGVLQTLTDRRKTDSVRLLMDELVKSTFSTFPTPLEDNEISRLLKQLVAQISLPEKATPTIPNEARFVDANHQGRCLNERIFAFGIGDWICNCPSTEWKEFVEYSCKILYLEHAEIFVQCVIPWIRGPQRGTYFSADPKELESPRNVAENIYVETNINGFNSVTLVETLCDVFGYHDDSPKIRTDKDNTLNYRSYSARSSRNP